MAVSLTAVSLLGAVLVVWAYRTAGRPPYRPVHRRGWLR